VAALLGVTHDKHSRGKISWADYVILPDVSQRLQQFSLFTALFLCSFLSFI
jgi:hypothetical protein